MLWRRGGVVKGRRLQLWWNRATGYIFRKFEQFNNDSIISKNQSIQGVLEVFKYSAR